MGKPGVLQSMGHKESDLTEQLKNKWEKKKKYLLLHIPLKPRRQLCVSSLRYQKTYTTLWLIMNTKYPTIFEGILHLKNIKLTETGNPGKTNTEENIQSIQF